jgi:hypothetical protein
MFQEVEREKYERVHPPGPLGERRKLDRRRKKLVNLVGYCEVNAD